jgi:hypothetical protein
VAGIAGDLGRRHSKAIHARAPVILKSSYIEIKHICPRILFLTIPLDQGQQAKRYENNYSQTSQPYDGLHTVQLTVPIPTSIRHPPPLDLQAGVVLESPVHLQPDLLLHLTTPSAEKPVAPI